jgi:hypothetical protein
MLLSDSSRVAPEAFRFRRTAMGLKVGLILPANGEADSSGHPEACGSQPLDLDSPASKLPRRKGHCPLPPSLSVHTVCLYLLWSVSKSGQRLSQPVTGQSSAVYGPAFPYCQKDSELGAGALFAHRFDATLMRLDDSFDEA